MTGSRQVRVLLVDDSAVVRGAIGRIIDATPDLRVATTATNGRQALEALKHTDVDVVLLDVEMPEMDGLTTLPLILERHPNVRVIMQSSLTQEGAAITMQALALGASDFIAKPTAKGAAGLAALEAEVTGKVRAIGRRPMAARASHRPAAAAGAAPRAVAPVERSILGASASAAPRVLAIASSTGGPNALVEVLANLPDLGIPIVITQHMPPVFTGLLAQRLARDCRRECVEATNGLPLRAGVTYIAPGDFHLVIGTHEAVPFARLTQTEPENHCRPAADVMFRSVANVYGTSAIAVVLTGMGEDGRRGCEVIRQHGGRVIVQDEATSVVWGMPGAVAQAGLADHVLPLPQVAGKIASFCGVPV